MARFYPIGATGGGAGSDDCTATAAELLKGYTGILKGQMMNRFREHWN
mgnify:CR=1 FL=1